MLCAMTRMECLPVLGPSGSYEADCWDDDPGAAAPEQTVGVRSPWVCPTDDRPRGRRKDHRQNPGSTHRGLHRAPEVGRVLPIRRDPPGPGYFVGPVFLSSYPVSVFAGSTEGTRAPIPPALSSSTTAGTESQRSWSFTPTLLPFVQTVVRVDLFSVSLTRIRGSCRGLGASAPHWRRQRIHRR